MSEKIEKKQSDLEKKTIEEIFNEAVSVISYTTLRYLDDMMLNTTFSSDTIKEGFRSYPEITAEKSSEKAKYLLDELIRREEVSKRNEEIYKRTKELEADRQCQEKKGIKT